MQVELDPSRRRHDCFWMVIVVFEPDESEKKSGDEEEGVNGEM